jgi:hypothetical protein
MNCKDIIKEYLIKNGYDGLYNENECGCFLKDLMPCGEAFSSCIPGYKCLCPDPFGEGYGTVNGIGPKKEDTDETT